MHFPAVWLLGETSVKGISPTSGKVFFTSSDAQEQVTVNILPVDPSQVLQVNSENSLTWKLNTIVLSVLVNLPRKEGISRYLFLVNSAVQ